MLNQIKSSTMKFKFLMAATLILAAACNQLQTVEDEKVIAGSNDRVTVTVNVNGGVSTRSTTVPDGSETAVTDIQLFAFNSDGSIDSYAKGSNSSMDISVTTGTKDFVALVNCPDLGATVKDKTSLMGTVSLLGNNSAGHFEMIGEAGGKSVSGKTSLDITVKRIVSKVVIQKISTDFSSPYLASLPFKVTGIFLSNVVASNVYSLDASSFEWVNKSEMNSSHNAKTLTQDSVDAVVNSTTPYSTQHTFYCYPNPTATDSDSGTWSERYTRLVVQTTLGGTVGYYSIKIPNIGSNKIYTITELKVTRRGSVQPYEDITVANAQFKIEVSEWETGKNFGDITI